MSSYQRMDPPKSPAGGGAVGIPDPLSNFDPPEYRDSTAEFLAEHQVDEICSQPYLTIDAERSVEDAIAELHETGVSSLLVTREDRLIGIFTERDVLEKVAERYERVRGLPVEDFMTAAPTIVYSENPSASAVAAIAIAGHRHVPVVNMDEQLLGIVSPRRVFRFIEESWS
ncbi:CBS domain-containing protein [Roseiconus lacunae]|uniref:CBS domain-containing protein n=1 Tax=Roseiconus lacunae TaxID=2605694 RepID=A0ABT7PPU5_9BACT|nr:CBS domain-containing protein [Roseiconus lacunae]MDM4018498.1 CBS domain-containing protein [Roseiconus lacunae]WRQ49082.1 CBS domain-containing protein [Stieleria sp. HD01]